MPRPLASEELILRATIDILAEHGVDGLAVDTVAATAGVSKATIYRRWGSRAQLVHAAITSLQRPLVDPDSGSLRTDLLTLLRQLAAYVSSRDSGRVFASFVDAATRDPELEALRKKSMADARDKYEQVLHRGIERGELPAAADLGLMIDLLMAPVIYRAHFERKPVRGSYADSVVDMVLAAARATDQVAQREA
ncbi:TetR/AcrR family transcriptional regulator [Nocardia sp. alder85J]|uniref:TetR/AcrR family transcriptional regulator n=1 Tax=Nocardia sp. alder85J TaxID=2862949 RepID=UPI001CD2887E|nr:TetR/AcrR family transcriptional regulator [Nocardia sp. alder85J]MCX4095504.1 TetR/AcrR family transcriptional regulator [Nocardia sp. alder85J]